MLHGALGVLPSAQPDYAPPSTIGASAYGEPQQSLAPWWRAVPSLAASSSSVGVARLSARGTDRFLPRVAFAEMPNLANGSRSPQQRFSRFSIVAACVAEAVAVVPTVHVELQIAEDSWALFLRVLISIVRLSPLLAPCLPWCAQLLSLWSRCQGSGPYERRIASCGTALLSATLCPEVRWGVAITLDMWYLLSTPLNKGLHQVPYIMLLVCNVLLCFGDTIMLIMMLAAKSDDMPEAERGVDIEAVHPRPITFTEEEAAASKFDPTCIICLSDFKNGDQVVQLPCNHTFHSECISKWLAKSRHCPLRCPQLVMPPMVTQTPVEGLLVANFEPTDGLNVAPASA